MRASVLLSAPFFALAALGQDSSSSTIDPFPQTSYLKETNSLGVVTGQPAVATSIPSQPAAASSQPAQPVVITTQPLPASIPALGSGIYTLLAPGTGTLVNSTRTLIVSANNSTTVVLGAPASGSASSTASGSGSKTTGAGASGSGASGSGSATGAKSTGAAPTLAAMAGSMVGLGAFVAAFL